MNVQKTARTLHHLLHRGASWCGAQTAELHRTAPQPFRVWCSGAVVRGELVPYLQKTARSLEIGTPGRISPQYACARVPVPAGECVGIDCMESIRTPEKEIAFLAALAATCSVTRACEAVGIGRRTAYEWRQVDRAFATRWDEAKRMGAEALEDECLRRAFDGVEEQVFYQGVACGTIRKYSDTLAIFYLKGAMPEKYRDNSKVELSGSLALNQMTDDEIRAELAALAAGGLLNAPGDVSDLV